jgi:hypothetical protein
MRAAKRIIYLTVMVENYLLKYEREQREMYTKQLRREIGS